MKCLTKCLLSMLVLIAPMASTIAQDHEYDGYPIGPGQVGLTFHREWDILANVVTNNDESVTLDFSPEGHNPAMGPLKAKVFGHEICESYSQITEQKYKLKKVKTGRTPPCDGMSWQPYAGISIYLCPTYIFKREIKAVTCERDSENEIDPS